MKTQIRYEVTPNNDGIFISACSGTDPVAFSSLTASDGFLGGRGLARVMAALENNEAGIREEKENKRVWLSEEFVGSLSSDQALDIGLPQDVPFSLWIRFNGPFASSNSTATYAWHDQSGAKVSVKEGSGLLSVASRQFRIPGSLMLIRNATKKFNETQKTLDDRLTAVSELKHAIQTASGVAVGVDKQLEDMRFRHASAVSIAPRVEKGGINFDPVFFSAQVTSDARDRGEVVKEQDSLLTPELQKKLASSFRTQSQAKMTYVLDRGEYLYVDPSLRVAVDVIKEYQTKPPEERARFARSPQSFIRERYLAAGFAEERSEELTEGSFVETDGFSARVIEIGLWQPPVLPFVRRAPNQWFPEEFGLKIGTRTITINENQLKPLAEAVAVGISQGDAEVAIPGATETVPASQDTLDALNAMLKLFFNASPVPMSKPDLKPNSSVDSGGEKKPKNKSILLVQDNFTSELFVSQFQRRASVTGFEPPKGLNTALKSHQTDGISWMQQAWSFGYPGVLLADDMGLGKTLQALAFISWLREAQVRQSTLRKPALVIAPISLLGNWISESKKHLAPGSLGENACLYGETLKGFKQFGSVRSDVIEGRATLDIGALKSCDWILTTYETMRDYNLSIGSVDFSLIIFDEMQKIKNPQSMMTNAAQALNGDFKIGLTGTPIENSLADIWTLFDTLMPGALGLGNLRDFLSTYRLDTPDALKDLKGRLLDSEVGKPAPMLRRMKTDVAKDLPAKLEKPVLQTMPDEQAIAYSNALKDIKQLETRKSKLDVFHQIRAISLHPRLADHAALSNADEYVNGSARLMSCMKIVDEIYARKEKVLLFVESLVMQEWLALFLRSRYSLEYMPSRIYGDTSADKRTAIVKRFQDAPTDSFDALILSPKAAGVGLTLTAATNVIHVTRWWNPAVEDQCTDRAYRIGQTKDVSVYYLQAIHPLYGDASFDRILDRLLLTKRQLSAGMLMPMETGNELDKIFEGMVNS